MRVMEIPPFPRKLDNPDLGTFISSRLSQTVVLWPEQAIRLISYTGWPNDPVARQRALHTVRSWPDESKAIPPRLRRIQHEWLRVADVFHQFTDLLDGQHQQRRGGPGIGKAITLVAANAKAGGTGVATLWRLWEKYKDVAHLVTAATLICAEARTRAGNEPLGPFGLSRDQFIPFHMAMLMPDLVIAMALEFQQRGLAHVPYARTEPVLDPETLWRIPADINVEPFAPPSRNIRSQDLTILGKRRAGNRGRAKAIPISQALSQEVAECVRTRSRTQN